MRVRISIFTLLFLLTSGSSQANSVSAPAGACPPAGMPTFTVPNSSITASCNVNAVVYGSAMAGTAEAMYNSDGVFGYYCGFNCFASFTAQLPSPLPRCSLGYPGAATCATIPDRQFQVGAFYPNNQATQAGAQSACEAAVAQGFAARSCQNNYNTTQPPTSTAQITCCIKNINASASSSSAGGVDF